MARRRLAPPVRFTFDGLYSSALPDETLLQALSRRRVPTLTRSIKYHRPRGPLCGTGQCAGCLVRVNGTPNVRACQTYPKEGDHVRTENAWPSVRLDLFAVFDRLFPRHLDTLHGFRRPLFLRPTYHAVVRRLAGTGRLPDDPPAAPPMSPERRECTYLVVGGGKAGARAARALASTQGAPKVLLLERRRVTALGKAPIPPNLRVERGTSLAFLPPPRSSGAGEGKVPFVAVASRETGGAFDIRASRVLLTTGAYDSFLVFAGNDRPGVLTGDAALALRSPGGAPPFRRALLFGSGDRARELLHVLRGRVAAISAPGEIPADLRTAAKQEGAEVLPGQLLLASRGASRVRGALLRDRKTGERTTLRVDAIVLAHRRVPNVPLYFQAGASMHWRGGTGAYYPDLDASGATSVPGLFAAGEGAGFLEERASEASVDAAVAGMLADRGPSGPDPNLLGRVPAEGRNELLGYYLELLRQPWLGKQVVCPCEDVVLDELDEAVHDGFTGTEVIKRYTGAGTGICQGRYCLPDVLLLLSLFEGRPPSEVGFITQRPPVWPVPLSDLAALPDGALGPEVGAGAAAVASQGPVAPKGEGSA